MTRTLANDRFYCIKLSWDEVSAQLTISNYAVGQKCVLDEDDVDRLLRCYEVAADPLEDLAEFFADEFPGSGYRVAQVFAAQVLELGHLVYA